MSFKELRVWRQSAALALRIKRVTNRFKRKEARLADQMCRSAESIPDAIAEGRGRRTDRDFAGFLTTAVSSGNELENQIQRAFDYGLIPESTFTELTDETISVRKQVITLRKRLEGK